MRLEKIKRNETIIYFTLWCVVIIACILHLATEHSLRGETWLNGRDLIMLCKFTGPLLVLFIINNYILIPNLLGHQRIRYYIACVSILIIVTGTVQFSLKPKRGPFIEMERKEYIHHHSASENISPDNGDLRMADFRHHMPPPAPIPGILYSLLVVGLNLGIWGLSRAVVFKIEKSQLVAANVESQLNQLKTQINPHFYMNMLNSIHGLVDLNPPKAKDLIMDMSRLMQYMLYDSAQDHVSLSKEIKFLSDYIRIIKDRYPKGKVEITSTFPTKDSTSNIMVPPLLYIGFVENAFKHGVDYRYESRIDVEISVDIENVTFRCRNKIHPKNEKKSKAGGIGLDNIRKRLALIYEGRSDLKIEEDGDIYQVTLTIPHHETSYINHR